MTPSVRVVYITTAPLGALDDSEVAAAVRGLERLGLRVSSRATVDADEAACEQALGPGSLLTVVLGGDGGAEADIVRRVLARVTGARLVLSDRMLAAMEEQHRRLDRPVPRAAERQALLPQGAVVWESPDAPPAWIVESAAGAFVVLPRGGGVHSVLARHVAPWLETRLGSQEAVRVRILRTAGVAEADLEERLADLRFPGSTPGSSAEIAMTVVSVEGEACVRLTARAPAAADAERALALAEAAVTAALGDDCYGVDADTLEQVVGRLLLDRGLVLSVAESCTGGLLGHRLTNVGGASAYFERGVVVYSNRAKQELLGVPEAILRAHGAVSAPCAEAMVRGICERTGSGCGLAVTGIAGPDGGTPAKPVGTVFIGLAVQGEVTSRRFRFSGDRRAVKSQSAQMALDMLRRRLRSLG